MKDYAEVQLLQQQVKAAWAKLPDDLKARLEPQILAAHQFALGVRNRTIPPTTPPPPHQLLMMYSLLHDDPDGLLKSAAAPAAEGLFPWIGGDGEVYFGDVTYDATDIEWGYLFHALEKTKGQTPLFKFPAYDPKHPWIDIDDDATLAILGDWGGWNGPAQKVAAAAKAAKADYFIHLGDVYYAGTNGGDGLEPYESTHFLKVWPGPSGTSFDLNSNHDMYAHATGYSGTTLAPGTAFRAQIGANVFALANKSFRIVGLDSAYYAPDDLYDTGSLGSPTVGQTAFLQTQAKLAAANRQDLIIMTHHNGLSADGSTPEPLWNEVIGQLSALAGKSVCWYWGHVHVGAVYQPRVVNGITIYPRCCGHGCIPWGLATGLRKSSVLWFEKEVLGPGENYFVTNGYATLALSGASMTETFCDQSGKAQWSDTWPSAAKAA